MCKRNRDYRILRDNNGKLTGSVYNYDRTFMIYILIGIFSISIVLVGGKKGFASLYALIFTFVCIICLYIPMLYVGINGITAALITAITILVVSIYILNGWSIKTKCAIIGTGIGVLISGIVAMIVGKVSGLDGYSMQDVESMVYIANNSKLNVSSILYAGILISSLGAVMDVSVSMVASMYEIYEKAPNLSLRQLFCSGMRVGHDMMGTMSNTLILAYAGSATGTILTIFSYEMPYLQIMGYNSVIVEIVCGLCGTLGVILTVPVQAVISCMAIKLFKNGKFAIQKQG